jgi:hypothetical protein
MKKLRILLLVPAASLVFTSCIKNEYYTTEPQPNPQPVGYQYVFDDNFNYDAHNWSFNDPANSAYVSIQNGLLNYSYHPVTSGTNTVAVATGMNTGSDFLIQSRIKSDNAMGLVFGVSNSNYGYSFFIDDNGSFAVYSEGNSATPVKTIIDWQYSSAIQAGWNDIEVEQVGNYWKGYINGTKVFEIQAQYLGGSKVGFIVLAGTTGYADYLTVQW